ncbi:MAG TPA: ABC transporter substrate-binding protein [Actinomycetota bacterium]|nr:ABC transporter substrate-binding protein [Actinomycetota bacterium]
MRPRTLRPLAAALAAALTMSACTDAPKKVAQERVALRVGLLYTTAGQGGDLASAVLGAAALATDAAAEDGVDIEIIEADYAGNPALAAEAAQGLATRSDAVVVGTDDNAVAGSLGGATVPVMHPFITADAAVTGDGSAFRFAPPNRLQAARIVTFLVGHRKYTRIGVLADDTPFGEEGVAGLREAFAGAGVTPVGTETFTPGGDVHTPLARMAQRNAQAVIVWVASPGEASRVVVDVHRSSYPYQLVLSGNMATPTFAKNASSQVAPVAFRDGILSVGTWGGPWFPLERIVGFYREFRTRNSSIPPVQAASVYDAILALARAARNRGTSSENLVRGLESLEDFEGAGTPVTFGPGKREGIDLDDVAMLGFTKNQAAPGGEFAPEVSTGGGFFSIVHESLDLPAKYAYLANVS